MPRERTPPVEVRLTERNPLSVPTPPKPSTAPPSEPLAPPTSSHPVDPHDAQSISSKITSAPTMPGMPPLPTPSTPSMSATAPTPEIPNIPNIPNDPNGSNSSNVSKPPLPLPPPKTPKSKPKTYAQGMMPSAVTISPITPISPTLPAPTSPKHRQFTAPSIPEGANAVHPESKRISNAMTPDLNEINGSNGRDHGVPRQPRFPTSLSEPPMPSLPTPQKPKLSVKRKAITVPDIPDQEPSPSPVMPPPPSGEHISSAPRLPPDTAPKFKTHSNAIHPVMRQSALSHPEPLMEVPVESVPGLPADHDPNIPNLRVKSNPITPMNIPSLQQPSPGPPEMPSDHRIRGPSLPKQLTQPKQPKEVILPPQSRRFQSATLPTTSCTAPLVPPHSAPPQPMGTPHSAPPMPSEPTDRIMSTATIRNKPEIPFIPSIPSQAVSVPVPLPSARDGIDRIPQRPKSPKQRENKKEIPNLRTVTYRSGAVPVVAAVVEDDSDRNHDRNRDRNALYALPPPFPSHSQSVGSQPPHLPQDDREPPSKHQLKISASAMAPPVTSNGGHVTKKRKEPQIEPPSNPIDPDKAPGLSMPSERGIGDDLERVSSHPLQSHSSNSRVKTKRKRQTKRKKSKKVKRERDSMEEQKQHLTTFFTTYSVSRNWVQGGKEKGVQKYVLQFAEREPLHARMAFLYSMTLYLGQIVGINKRCIRYAFMLLRSVQAQIDTLCEAFALILQVNMW